MWTLSQKRLPSVAGAEVDLRMLRVRSGGGVGPPGMEDRSGAASVRPRIGLKSFGWAHRPGGGRACPLLEKEGGGRGSFFKISMICALLSLPAARRKKIFCGCRVWAIRRLIPCGRCSHSAIAGVPRPDPQVSSPGFAIQTRSRYVTDLILVCFIGGVLSAS